MIVLGERALRLVVEGFVFYARIQSNGSMNSGARIQLVSATPIFVLVAFDCSLDISSSHTSLGVL